MLSCGVAALRALLFLNLLGFFNPNRGTVNFLAVKALHGSFRFSLFWHFNKTKAFGATRSLISYQRAGLNAAVRCEQLAQRVFGGGAVEIAYQ